MHDKQQQVNSKLCEFAKSLGVKLIVTSDAHFQSPQVWESYKLMHLIGNTKFDFENAYKGRYLLSKNTQYKKLYELHQGGLKKDEIISLYKNIKELAEKCDPNILDTLTHSIPKIPNLELKNLCVQKLKEAKIPNEKLDEYKSRLKKELQVIYKLNFQDYFCVVYDYINFAKSQGIKIGVGRGSACNSLVVFLLGITQVDPLFHGLIFERFLRVDKKKLPDIDCDFENARRHEVIDYIFEKYPNRSAKISNYGTYRLANLLNDLSKHCGLSISKNDPNGEENKIILDEIKATCELYINDSYALDVESLKTDKKYKYYNDNYDNILIHFQNMYGLVKFSGVHASGIAITQQELSNYTATRVDKDGKQVTVYDLNDLEDIGVIKFDILGLKTLDLIKELENITNTKINIDELYTDKKIIQAFKNGDTVGIFQYDGVGARKILKEIQTDNFAEIVAVNAINRPASLSQKMHEKFANNKLEGVDKTDPLYKYTKDTYGCIIYQEQILSICVNVGNLSYPEADKVIKLASGKESNTELQIKQENEKRELKTKFVQGCKSNNIPKEKASEIFDSVLTYSFNKGHATAYSITALMEMFYKVYYPYEYWTIKINLEEKKEKIIEYRKVAKKQGVIFVAPHINGEATTKITNYNKHDKDREYQKVTWIGLDTINNITTKVATEIQKYQPYYDYSQFMEAVEIINNKEEKKIINKRVLDALRDNDCLEFNEKILNKINAKLNGVKG